MENLTSLLDFNHIIIYAFLLLTLIVGLIAGRRIKSMKDYALANKSYSAGILSITLIATWVEGYNILGRPGQSFSEGIIQFTSSIGVFIGFIVFGTFIGPRMIFFNKSITLGDVSEILYGKESKILIGLLSFAFAVILVSMQILAIGSICNSLLNMNRIYSMLFGGLIVISYSFMGGVRSVTITDILQFIALTLFVVVIGNVVVSKAGGIDNIFQKINLFNPEKLKIYGHKNFNSRFWRMLYNCLGLFFLAPPYIQRMLMSQDDRKVKKMFYLGAGYWIFLSVMIVLIGLGAFIVFPDASPRYIMPHVLLNLFPQKAISFLVVGLLAIVMSTADSYLNSASISVTHDLLKPLGEKMKINFDEFKIIKYVTIIIGLFAILISYLAYFKNLNLRQLLFYNDTLIASIAVPFIAGIMNIKTDKRSFWLSVIVALSINIPFELTGNITYPIRLIAVLSSLITFFVSHIMLNKGIIFANRISEKKVFTTKDIMKQISFIDKLKNCFPTPKNILKYSQTKIEKSAPNFLSFSIIVTLGYMLPFQTIKENYINHQMTILIVRSIGVLLIALIMIKDAWPKKLRNKIFPIFWYFTVMYNLVFSIAIIYLLGASTDKWPAEIAIAMVMMAIICDKTSFAALTTLGLILALSLTFVLQGYIDFFPALPTINYAYTFIYGFVAYIVITWVMKRNEELYNESEIKVSTVLGSAMNHETKNYTGYMLSSAQIIEKSIFKKLIPTLGENKEEGFFIKKEDYKTLENSVKNIIQLGNNGLTTNKLLGDMLVKYRTIKKAPFEKVKIYELIQEILNNLPVELEQKENIILESDNNFEAELPKGALKHIIYNLIKNAYLHGKADKIEIWLSDRTIHVKDNGKGISKERLPRLFDLFYTNGNGMGVGLALVRLMIDTFNGDITVKSKQGKSSFTEFTIKIPLKSKNK